MSDIDWSLAPEGATHFDNDESAQVFCNKSGWWANCSFTSHDNQVDWGTDRYISKPEIKPSKPVYTQEMEDNGDLPLVGMECMFRHQSWGVAQYEQAEVLAITKEYLLVQIKGQPCENHFHLRDISFKPIAQRTDTDTDKAIDDIYSAINGDDDKLGGCDDLLKAIKAGKIHGVSFTGSES